MSSHQSTSSTSTLTTNSNSLPGAGNLNVNNTLNSFASSLQNTYSGTQLGYNNFQNNPDMSADRHVNQTESLFTNSGGAIPRNSPDNVWSPSLPHPLTNPNNIPLQNISMSNMLNSTTPRMQHAPIQPPPPMPPTSNINGAVGQQYHPPLSEEDMNNPLQSLTLRDMWRVLVQPLSAKIDNLENTVTQRVDGLNRRVQVLENELSKEVTKTDHLTNTIINMQKSLNRVDANERANNLIIMGLPEEPISNGTSELTTDIEKFSHITRSINLPDIAENHVSTYTYARIGQQTTNGKPRNLKISIPDKDKKDAIKTNAKQLKQLMDPWKKIFINKDTHYGKHSVAIKNTRFEN